MRFFEIIGPNRAFYATDRFRREYARETHQDPSIRNVLVEFLHFKQNCPLDAQFNRKDSPYRFGNLKGFRHCHLRYGKRIILYRIDAYSVYLTSLVDHSAYDGHNPLIAGYLRNVDGSDYTPFSMAPSTAPAEMEDTSISQEITSLAYDLSGPDDRAILLRLAEGDPRPFLVFTRLIPATDDQVRAFFKTKERMIAFATKVLNDTEVRGA